MIKVYASDNSTGPAIIAIKGIRVGWQWVFSQLNQALCYRADGTLTLDFSLTDLPSSLIRRIILVQQKGEYAFLSDFTGDKTTEHYFQAFKTDDVELIEGNEWSDTFWGVCRGQGENWLGKILMKTRDNLRKTEK